MVKEPHRFILVVFIKRNCKTVGYIQDTFSSPAAQENSNDSFLVSNFSHTVKVINYT